MSTSAQDLPDQPTFSANVRDIHGCSVETFEFDGGWYWQMSSLLPRHEPKGTFATEDDALEDARRTLGGL